MRHSSEIWSRNKCGPEPSLERINRTVLASFILLLVFLGVVGGAYATGTMFSPNTPEPQNPDFTIATNPLSLFVAQRSQGALAIDLSSLNGFAGSVNVTANLSPIAPDATITISPNSISLLTGSGTLSVIVTIPTGVAIGSYLLNITAASRTLSHSIVASLTVTGPEDFELTTGASSVTMSAGSSSNSTITVTSINGFSGTVTLTAIVSQGKDNGPKPTLSINTTTLTPGGLQTVVLSLSTSNGNRGQSYTVTVLAESGSLSHSVAIDVTGLAKTGSSDKNKA